MDEKVTKKSENTNCNMKREMFNKNSIKNKRQRVEVLFATVLWNAVFVWIKWFSTQGKLMSKLLGLEESFFSRKEVCLWFSSIFKDWTLLISKSCD